jgi:hypothetical protein
MNENELAASSCCWDRRTILMEVDCDGHFVIPGDSIYLSNSFLFLESTEASSVSPTWQSIQVMGYKKPHLESRYSKDRKP